MTRVAARTGAPRRSAATFAGWTVLGACFAASLLAPQPGIGAFAGAVADSLRGRPALRPAPDDALFVDRLATLAGQNLLLRFSGFGRDDPRVEFIYYRAVFALWPRRVLLGPADFPVTRAAEILRAQSSRPDTAWLRSTRVSHVVRFEAAADGVIALRVEDVPPS